jgi:hypothetical protein
MKTENQDGSDQRSEPTITAILVDPGEWKRIRSVTIAGYDGIRALFEKEYNIGVPAAWNLNLAECAELESATLCKVEGNIYLSSWGDCREFLTAPAWRTSLAPHVPMHGLTVIHAYDLSTGESVDCPISAKQFAATIEWEDFENRQEPHRPNKEWADKGGYEWAVGDGKGNIHASGSTWEEAAQ